MHIMKKQIIIVISILVLIAGTITIVMSTKKNNLEKPRIVVTFPKEIKDLDVLGNILLDDFTSKKNIPHYLIVDDSNYYLDELKNKLKNAGAGDVFYVVNNRTVNSPEITNPAYDFNIKDSSFKKIPDSFKSISEVNKSFTYTPFTWAPWGVYYNKRVFETHGLQEPENFSQLEEVCEKLQQNEITPFSMMQNLKWPFTSWFDYISIRNYGAAFHNNLLSGRVDFRSEEVKNIFLTLHGLISDGWLYSTDSDDWKVMVETLVNGETAMALSSTFLYDNIADTEREYIGWFPFPVINSDYNDEVITSAGFLTSEVTANLNGVKDFYKYISSDGQKIINDYTEFIPINKKIIKNTDREDLIKGFDNAERSSKITPSFERNNHPQLLNPLKYALNRLFSIENENEIITLLDELEEIRTQI